MHAHILKANGHKYIQLILLNLSSLSFMPKQPSTQLHGKLYFKYAFPDTSQKGVTVLFSSWNIMNFPVQGRWRQSLEV